MISQTQEQPRASVVIVDDHEQVRRSLRSLIARQPDFAVVAEASSGTEALRCVAETMPAVVVLDLELPDISGVEVLKKVVERHPETRVLIFSSLPADQFADLLHAQGAAAFVSKEAGMDAVVFTMRLLQRELSLCVYKPTLH